MFLMVFGSFSIFAANGLTYENSFELPGEEKTVTANGEKSCRHGRVLNPCDAAVRAISSSDYLSFEQIDVDGNGEWAISDVTVFLNALSGSIALPDANLDINGDGRTNIADVSHILNVFSVGCLHKKVVDKGFYSTCREFGLTDGSHCAYCGKIFEEQLQIPKDSHVYVNDVCYNCGLWNPEFCRHTYGAWQTVTPAGCVTKGERMRVCPLCESVEKQTVPECGHRWKDWTTVKEATIFEAGEQTRQCAVCGQIEKREIPVYVPTDAEKAAMARKVAEEIAERIDASVSKDATDLERVSKAAEIVSEYCSRCVYTTEGKDYRQPYGVFVKGEYSCAGATRALGLVLECMGYEWTHKNENQWTHQWCVLEMDGQIGYADGQVGWAGYGKHPVDED